MVDYGESDVNCVGMRQNNMTLEYLKKIIEKKYLHRGDYTLSSGQKSDKYFDIKSMIGNYDQYVLQDVLTDKLHRDIDHKTYSTLGGLELGGALIVASMVVSDLHTKCFIRKTERTHGLKKNIEGNPVSPILLVDDVISTGDTIQTALNFCDLDSHKVVGTLCVINRSGLDNINNLPIYSLFKETDFK